MAPLQALLWDVDGTLADTEQEGHRPAFNGAFAEAGLPWHWDRPTYQRLLAVTGGRERIRAWLGEQQSWPAAAGDDPSSWDPTGWIENLHLRKQAHYRQRLAEGPLPLRPGVERLLLEAQAAGLRQALVTTSGRSAVQALLQPYPRLQSCFELWICGEDVGAKKPHPEGYERALAALGISAGSAIAIEDSAQGLAAARGAGLAVVISGWAAGENSLTGDGSLAGAALVVDHLDAGYGGPVTVACLRALLPWRPSDDKAAPAINPFQWPAAIDR